MHVEVARQAKHVLDDSGLAKEPVPATRPKHDLGTAFGAGEGDQRACDVLVDDFVERSFELVDQFAGQRGVVGPCRACVPALTTCTANSCAWFREAIRAARRSRTSSASLPVTRDDETFASLPSTLDVVSIEITLQRVLHPISQPKQRQFPQRGEVARRERSSKATRRSCRRDRCCRGPCAAVGPRA